MDVDDQLLNEFARRLSRPGERSWQEQETFLRSPIIRALAVGVGVNVEGLDRQRQDVRESAIASIQAAIWFADLGWTVSSRAPHRHAYVEAVQIWEETANAAAVDECLTRWWNDGTVFLRGTFGPMVPLAGRHEGTLDLLLERNRLLAKALDYHERGDYEASVLIVLSEIDGLVFDLTDPAYGFFLDSKDHNFEDDATVAGMPVFLRAARKAILRDPKTTSMSGAFQRGPIVHGRQLAFGTLTNSTKAFALLGGVVEWLKPKAHAKTERLQQEHEAKYAGSDERDGSGRRLDARGFADTRDSLRWLAIRETNEYRSTGYYRDDLEAMFPSPDLGMMKRRDAIRLNVAADGRSYWAWAKTDSDFCFGIAAAEGEPTNSYYADVGPPHPPSVDDKWMAEVGKLPPDWSDD
jgi:hypothetical protein